jgi:hypothetical protein
MDLVRMWVSAATQVCKLINYKLVFSLLYLFFHEGHGGFGYTSRKWGLTLDTIQSLEVVLANSAIVKVSKNSYPDLFWVSIFDFVSQRFKEI